MHFVFRINISLRMWGRKIDEGSEVEAASTCFGDRWLAAEAQGTKIVVPIAVSVPAWNPTKA